MEKSLKKYRNKSRINKRYKKALLLFILLNCFLIFQLPVFAASVSDEITAPSSTAILSTTIRITGQIPSPPEEYSVRLTAIDDAPIPDFNIYSAGTIFTDAEQRPADFSQTNYLDIVISGPGTVRFSFGGFKTVGVYRYTISQNPGNYPGAHYDADIYNLTVTVTNSEEGSGLKSTAVLLKDNKKHDAAEFVNEYSSEHIFEDNNPEIDIDLPVDKPADAPIDDPTIEPDIPVPPDNQHLGTLIQTGQLNWPIRLLGIAGVILIVFGAILMTGGNRRHRPKS